MIELSEQECAEIVRKSTNHQDVKNVKFSIEGFGNYLGFLGEYFTLKIEANVNGTWQDFKFFMKSLPTHDLKQRKMLIETGIFKKEVTLYQNLLPRLSDLSRENSSWCPKAFLHRNDLLVLEDLALKGYKILPSHQAFEQTHVKMTLKSLASFHSSSIVYEKNGKSILDEFAETLFETSVDNISWYHSGLKTIFDIALERSKFGKSHRELIQKEFYEKIFQSIEIMESSPYNVVRVLTHRDIWRNNLMFKFNEDFGLEKPLHCVLLDFQTARHLPITIDVLMAIICTTSSEHQEKFYSDYVDFYYKELSEELKCFNINLETIMSFDDFTKSCSHHKAFALVYNVIVMMITRIPREYFSNFNEDEYRDFAEGNRSKFVLDYMSKDLLYEKCLIEAVEEVASFVFNL